MERHWVSYQCYYFCLNNSNYHCVLYTDFFSECRRLFYLFLMKFLFRTLAIMILQRYFLTANYHAFLRNIVD